MFRRASIVLLVGGALLAALVIRNVGDERRHVDSSNRVPPGVAALRLEPGEYTLWWQAEGHPDHVPRFNDFQIDILDADCEDALV